MNIKSTHTVAQLELSPAAYAEIASKLRDAGYDHCFGIGNDEGLIDMNGIGVTAEKRKALEPAEADLMHPATPEAIRDVAAGTCQVSFAKWIEIEQLYETMRRLRTDREFVHLCALRGSIALDANDALHVGGTSTTELERLRLLEQNVLHLLEDSKHAIRVREGGGPEDVAMSLAVTFVKLEGRLARLLDQINSPMTANYLEAVKNEALHQRERWGVDHDEGKTDLDWLFLIGFLGGKAVEAGKNADFVRGGGGDLEVSNPERKHDERRLHHIIALSAAALNWHEARSGGDNRMRPGIAPPKLGNSGVAELREVADGLGVSVAPESERSGNA